jgi:hypothetical protein
VPDAEEPDFGSPNGSVAARREAPRMRKKLAGFVRALALAVPTALIATAHPASAAFCGPHFITVIILDQVYTYVVTLCN